MPDTVFEVFDGIAVCVKVTRAVPLSIEVFLKVKCVIAVNRDDKFNIVAVGFDHEFIKAIQHSVIVR